MKPFALSPDFIEEQIAHFHPETKCDQWHPGSCNHKFISQTFSTAQSMSKLYLMVHLVPLLFKIKKIKKRPVETLKKFIIGYIRSLLFAGLYSGIVRRVVCLLTQFFGYQNYAMESGFIGGLSLLFQTQGRQAEIALYCMSRTMDVGWNWLKRRNYVKDIKYGDVVLFGIAIAILGYFYQQEKDAIKPSYLSIISKLLGEI